MDPNEFVEEVVVDEEEDIIVYEEDDIQVYEEADIQVYEEDGIHVYQEEDIQIYQEEDIEVGKEEDVDFEEEEDTQTIELGQDSGNRGNSPEPEEDETMREYHELAALLQQQGVQIDLAPQEITVEQVEFDELNLFANHNYAPLQQGNSQTHQIINVSEDVPAERCKFDQENSFDHWAAIVCQEVANIPGRKQNLSQVPAAISEPSSPEEDMTTDQQEEFIFESIEPECVEIEEFRPPEPPELGDESNATGAPRNDHEFVRPYPITVRESIEMGRRAGRTTPATLRYLQVHRMTLRRPHPAVQLIEYLCQCLNDDSNRSGRR